VTIGNVVFPQQNLKWFKKKLWYPLPYWISR